ncbi:MAG TPA: tetratricopeptide repeat protein [Desulfonatronum sp.]|nr:tetratricopeptide repeat protein [Desulfonatronum sp.]
MKPSSAVRQKGLYILLLFLFGASAHFGYAAVYPDRVLFRRAEQHLQAGNPEQAMQLYQQALDLGLRWPRAVIRVIEAALAAQNHIAAEQGLENLLTSKTRLLPDELLNLAVLFDRFDRPELARELLEHYPRQLLASPDLTLYLAGLYRRSMWYREADLLYTQLAEIPGMKTTAALEQAEMYGWQGRYIDAEELLRGILQMEPENRMARIILGRVLSWDGRFIEAITEYKKALGEV